MKISQDVRERFTSRRSQSDLLSTSAEKSAEFLSLGGTVYVDN